MSFPVGTTFPDTPVRIPSRRAVAGGARIRESNFLITVNTNVAPRSMAEAQAIFRDMQRTGDSMIQNRANLLSILRFRGPGTAANIVSVVARGRPEVGPRFNRIHQHIVLTIRHTVPGGGIHVRPDVIKAFYRRNGTTAAVKRTAYVNVHGFSSRDVLLRYIEKSSSPHDDPDDIRSVLRQIGSRT